MLVSGFSIIRNALKFDYPIKEAILSILSICDEFVISVGNSEDDTLDYIKNIKSDKIKIVESVWNDNLREGGRVLAEETNKAFNQINNNSDWAFYIQADEVLHERYLEKIYKIMKENLNKEKVDGILFNYKHFYGSYDYIGESNRWYRKEIRIIRNKKNIYSYGDAQGFRKDKNKKLNVIDSGCEIYHYGWVKHPKHQQEKQLNFNKMWHSDEWVDNNIAKVDEFDYSQIDSLELFTGSHPLVMQERIKMLNWKFEHDISIKKYSSKEKIQRIIEKIFKRRIGEYKNYYLIK